MSQKKVFRTTREFAEAIIRVSTGWDKEDTRWDDLVGILEYNERQIEQRIAARKQ